MRDGNDIYTYPGFVMLQNPSKDFALIDVRELQIRFSQSNFIEEEGVPDDSEVIGQTWKKANKDLARATDGSPGIIKYRLRSMRRSSFVAEPDFTRSIRESSSYSRTIAFA